MVEEVGGRVKDWSERAEEEVTQRACLGAECGCEEVGRVLQLYLYLFADRLYVAVAHPANADRKERLFRRSLICSETYCPKSPELCRFLVQTSCLGLISGAALSGRNCPKSRHC